MLTIGAFLSCGVAPVFFLIKPCISHLPWLFSRQCSVAPELVSVSGRFLTYFTESIIFVMVVCISYVPVIGSIYLFEAFNGLLHFIEQQTKSKSLSLKSKLEMELQAKVYRHIQLLVGLFNECFQSYTLPISQFCGSTLLICSWFGMVVLHEQMSVFTMIAFPFLSVVITLAMEMITEISSLTLHRSRKIVGKWWKREVFQRNEWFRKFSKSCPTVKIKMGALLAVDRDRFAIIMRFCLQRTFFLIVLSRK